jgi:hypothetical protein
MNQNDLVSNHLSQQHVLFRTLQSDTPMYDSCKISVSLVKKIKPFSDGDMRTIVPQLV